MSTDIVSALPRAADGFTRRVTSHVLRGAEIDALTRQGLALTAGESEASIYDRGTETPLRCERPDRRDCQVPQHGLDTPGRESW